MQPSFPLFRVRASSCRSVSVASVAMVTEGKTVFVCVVSGGEGGVRRVGYGGAGVPGEGFGLRGAEICVN